jgi:predicted RND superfamily exporter protein
LRSAGAVALLLAAALATPFALRVGVDNRIELWLDPAGETADRYARFREAFGSDELVVVAYEGREIFAADALAAQLEALERLEAVPHVARVSGVPAVWRDLFFEEAPPERLRAELLGTPFYRHLVVADDGRVAGLLVETAPPADAVGRRDLVHALDLAVAPLREHGFTVHLAGPPVLNAVLDETSAREALRSFPVAVAVSVVVLVALLRCWRAALAAVACAGLAILLAVGVVGASGRSLNMVTSALPSLLWVLTLSGMIYIVQSYRGFRTRLDRDGALAAALRETVLPCALAALTTALGFLSLLSASMRPVRELGAFAAAGMLLSLAVNLCVGPLLLRVLRVPGAEPSATRPAAWLRRVGEVGLRRPGPVLAAALLFALGTATSLGRIRIESDPLAFLPTDSATVRAYRAVGERLTGFYTLELVVETPSGWLDDASWPALERLADALAAQPGVARVLSPLDLLKQLGAWSQGGDPAAYALPADGRAAREIWAEHERAGGLTAFGLVGPDGRSVRLAALVNVMSSSRFLAIRDAAEQALAGLPAPLEGFATGVVLQLVEAQLSLVDTQLRSFATAFLTVFACILLGLRSAGLVLVSMPPNLMPIVVAFAGMALGGIPLDAATVMVASIALGIAVDDTVHFLSGYRRRRVEGLEPAAAVRATTAEVGSAMVVTALVASIGFLALVRSAFVPIRFFGILAGMTMIVAVLSDLLLVPAILVVGRRRGEELPARQGRG